MPTPRTYGSRWVDVYNVLRSEIRALKIPPGAALPTIVKLSTEYGLSRHGARRVLEKLRDDGLASSWQGKGYRVAVLLTPIRMEHSRPAFHENVARAGRVSASKLASAKSIGLPSRFARRMDERPGHRVLYTETLRKVDDQVSALSMDFFSSSRFADLSKAIAETGSVSKALEAHGVAHYRRDFTSIVSRLPTAHEALMLEVPRSQPVYETVGGNLDKRGRVFQVSTAVWRGDRIYFEI